MKKPCLLLLCASILVGSTNGPASVEAGVAGAVTDIRQDVTAGGTVPRGFAELRITASLKTHKPGSYSACAIHGTPEYRLLVDIDGEVIALPGSLREEDTEPRGVRDAEAGEGMRYIFEKTIRLRPGVHRIVIAVPEDSISVERDIDLREGSPNSLVLEPVYGLRKGNQRPGSYGETSFYEGLTGFKVVLNGRPV